MFGRKTKGSHRIFKEPKLSDDDKGVTRIGTDEAGPLVVTKQEKPIYNSLSTTPEAVAERKAARDARIEQAKTDREEMVRKAEEEDAKLFTYCGCRIG